MSKNVDVFGFDLNFLSDNEKDALYVQSFKNFTRRNVLLSRYTPKFTDLFNDQSSFTNYVNLLHYYLDKEDPTQLATDGLFLLDIIGDAAASAVSSNAAIEAGRLDGLNQLVEKLNHLGGDFLEDVKYKLDRLNPLWQKINARSLSVPVQDFENKLADLIKSYQGQLDKTQIDKVLSGFISTPDEIKEVIEKSARNVRFNNLSL